MGPQVEQVPHRGSSVTNNSHTRDQCGEATKHVITVLPFLNFYFVLKLKLAVILLKSILKLRLR